MSYNRYNPGQGYDPTPQEANWLGGMAYNPYSSGTDFGFALRNTLNNLLAHKQGQAQANKEQQRYDEEQARLARKEALERQEDAREQQKFESEEAERKRKLLEPSPYEIKVKEIWTANPTWTEGQVRNKALGIETPEEKAAKIKSTLELKHGEVDIEVAHRVPREPKEPSETRLRYAEIDKAVEADYMTPEEGAMAKIGIAKDKDDTMKGAAIRQANEKAVADVFNSTQNPEKEARKSVAQSGGASPFTTEGYRMDMPRKYSIAKKNITDGVATGEDNKTVEKYDAMYGYFISKIKDRYKSFDDWMKTSPNAKRPEFDKDQIKKWFDIYVR